MSHANVNDKVLQCDAVQHSTGNEHFIYWRGTPLEHTGVPIFLLCIFFLYKNELVVINHGAQESCVHINTPHSHYRAENFKSRVFMLIKQNVH